ncbi:fructoselysine 6-kinase [Sporanaerobacter acetigenes DSM 13106]|uniref:Fructoselysine 6-kinase n=2 Tax=Sporanaerobacter acetigenes TaxID=165813 RepID=A0A1M5SQG3_9FIRM|nr:fructoselysine 6-kinase [Sporanaerobacter acetigenes DSM 13106]
MKIAAVGDNCIDLYENLEKAFPGGNPVNVAVYFKRLGGEASYTGVVGDDEYGKFMIDAIRNKGVNVSNIKILPGETAITHVELVGGERILGDYEEGVMKDFKISDEDIEFFKAHDMVVSGLWGMIEEDLYKIKERGIPIAFDFANKLDSPIVEKTIYDVDYAFFSYDGGDDGFIREYIKKNYRKGPKLIIVTLGEKGSICYDGTRFVYEKAIPCEVVDAMGAGDSYIAGFLFGVLSGKEIKECMKMGTQNASTTIKYCGAW